MVGGPSDAGLAEYGSALITGDLQLHPETESIPLLDANSGRYGFRWGNTGRSGTSWKIRIYEQAPSGKQLAVYERKTTLIRIEHAVGPIAGITECKCPKSDALRAGTSHFRGGGGVCMSVDTTGALEVLIARYFSPSTSQELIDESGHVSVSLPSAVGQSAEDRRRRLALAPKKPQKVEITTTVFVRNIDVIAEVLDRAAGVCELCESPAPFLRASNLEPFLEVHHRMRLADGGDDTVENAIAVCPNCHRRAHFG